MVATLRAAYAFAVLPFASFVASLSLDARHSPSDFQTFTEHHRRDLAVPTDTTDHGSYAVSRHVARTAHSVKARHHSKRRTRRSHSRRDTAGTAGFIDLMSPTTGASEKKLGSLSVDSSDSEYTVAVSEHSKARIYLVPVTSSHSSSGLVSLSEQDQPTRLQVAISSDRWCMMFDPHAETGVPMTLEQCFGDSDSETEPEHKSQYFSYNKQNGVLRPMWFKDEDDGTADETLQRDDSLSEYSTGNDTEASPSSTSSNDPQTPSSATRLPTSSLQNATLEDATNQDQASSPFSSGSPTPTDVASSEETPSDTNDISDSSTPPISSATATSAIAAASKRGASTNSYSVRALAARGQVPPSSMTAVSTDPYRWVFRKE